MKISAVYFVGSVHFQGTHYNFVTDGQDGISLGEEPGRITMTKGEEQFVVPDHKIQHIMRKAVPAPVVKQDDVRSKQAKSRNA